ncbi:hypothetical protein IWZ01DRAFT_503756 [Phyllosticta capitalensis]
MAQRRPSFLIISLSVSAMAEASSTKVGKLRGVTSMRAIKWNVHLLMRMKKDVVERAGREGSGSIGFVVSKVPTK